MLSQPQRMPDMPRHKLAVLALIISISALCWASAHGPALRTQDRRKSLATREDQIWASALHDSQFATVPHTPMWASCEVSEPPEALATPNPLLGMPDSNARVTVSFIIGTDGRVHSPLILESVGSSEDRNVLDTVRAWRYRPALCNGVPTEAEAKIEFSSR